MLYKKMGGTGIQVSSISMGGHEYLPDGRSRGFNEDFQRAVTPDYLFEGFGQERRKAVLSIAFEHGINFFDVTQDSEKEALGRNLKEVKPPYEIYIQTRPEGMVYTYDLNNAKMGKYELLEREVQRCLKLLQRDCVDFYNFAFMRSALDHDPEYLDKIAYNVDRLKREGLIRFACADTFSGEYTYMKQIEKGCFDAVYINFNFADACAKRNVFPAAREKNLSVISREAFMKGELFKMGEEAGLTDRSRLAHLGMKWNLSHEEVCTVVLGTSNPDHMRRNLRVLDDLRLNEEDEKMVHQIKEKSKIFKLYEEKKTREFLDE